MLITVNILIDGMTKEKKFSIEEWSINSIEDKMRSTFNVTGGCLERGGLPVNKVVPGYIYDFADFSRNGINNAGNICCFDILVSQVSVPHIF